MAFFKGLMDKLIPGSKPEPPPPVSIPADLPKIKAGAAAEVCQEFQPGPEAAKLLQPEQTPSQYLQALQDNQMPQESVNFLAHGLPDQESVAWAAKSSEMAGPPANPADAKALDAAKAWVKAPNPANQKAAAEAAAQTDMKSSAALAAQGAAWANPAEGAPRLTPKATSGAVLLAGGETIKKPDVPIPEAPPPPKMPEIPTAPNAPVEPPPLSAEQKQEMMNTYNPFVQQGVDIASGKAGLV